MRQRRKKLLAVWLVLALTTGCSGRGDTGVSHRLYYPTNLSGEGGQAVDWEERQLSEEPTAEELLLALLRGPESEHLRSPFPRNTALRSITVDETGTAQVDLSEPYGGLSGIEQTLSDSVITLTLCQREDIQRVHIIVEGSPRPYRDRVLSPEDLLLDNGSGAQGEQTVWLWFPGDGELAREERSITLAPGDELAVAALQALTAGPEDPALQRVCPQGALFTLTRWEHAYHLDLTEAWFGPEGDQLWLPATLATLAEVDPQASVSVTAQGKALGEVVGLDLSGPVRAAALLPGDPAGEAPSAR